MNIIRINNFFLFFSKQVKVNRHEVEIILSIYFEKKFKTNICLRAEFALRIKESP